MLYQSLLVIVLGCAGLSRSAPGSIISPHQSTKTNEVVRAGFSSACRAPKSISRMVGGSEVVVEAAVVAVSPVRNNIYAVTLQVGRNNRTF